MSGAERKRRENYRKQRKRWLLIQAIVIAVVAVSMLVVFLSYRNLSETVYITYRETSTVDYKVHLKENDFYEEEWLDKDQAYVASLIDEVRADFEYSLDMDVEGADYEYSYKIEALMEVVDNSSKVAIFRPVYTLKEADGIKQNSNDKLSVKESVSIDYTQYNELAQNFKNAYGLNDTTSLLTVRMSVTVIGSCKEFQENSQNHYVVSLSMPLTQKALTIEMQSTVPTGESKVLACDNVFNVAAFKNTLLVLGIVECALLIGLLCFAFLTRNEDINYAIQVQKLLSGYSSYIQKINNGFDTEGYQLLAVDTFNEMLAIRDTIQSPILMSENRDKTRSLFFIPTNTKLLYTYEIKVENYDELYQDPEDMDGAAILKEELAATETRFPLEEVAVETPIEVAEEETFGGRFGSSLDYSFEAKLALSEEVTRGYYKKIVDYVLSYGVNLIRSRKKERIYKGRNLFAVLTFRGKKLAIALAMDPVSAHSKYHAKDMSALKKFEKTPMLMRITSERKVKYAIELLERLFAEAGLENKNLSVTTKPVRARSKKYLLAQGQIKIKERK